MIDVGYRARELREAAGLEQGLVAEAMGWAQSTLSKFESGNSILSPNEVHRLALAIDDLKHQRDELYKVKQLELLGCATIPATNHEPTPKEAA